MNHSTPLSPIQTELLARYLRAAAATVDAGGRFLALTARPSAPRRDLIQAQAAFFQAAEEAVSLRKAFLRVESVEAALAGDFDDSADAAVEDAADMETLEIDSRRVADNAN